MRVESVLACACAAIVAVGVAASSAAAGTTPQKIEVTTAAPSTADYNTAFTVAANSRRVDDNTLTGLAVTFTASGSCTNVGTGSNNRVQMTSGSGTCTVQFDQAGDATYAAATPVVETVAATKADQTITFGSLQAATYKEPDFQFAPAFASSNLDVVYTASGQCAVNGTTVHVTGGGSCTITASQPGDANYNAAPPVSQSFAIAKASQQITFGDLNDRPLGAPDFRVHATSDSKLPVSFTAKGACKVTGARVHLTRVGTCTITASQPGNADYKAAKRQSQSFDVQKPACTVPRLVGKTPAAAKKALAGSHCGVGPVRHEAGKHGRVVAQDQPAGRRLPVGTKIGFVVGR